MTSIDLYNIFVKKKHCEQVELWKDLMTDDQYIFLNRLMIDNEKNIIMYLMGMDYITFEQHLFLVELNHDLKKDFEFIDHDTAIQLFKDRLLQYDFLFDFIMSYASETRDFFNIKRSKHFYKFIPILLKLYEKYKDKFLAKSAEEDFNSVINFLKSNIP